MQACRNSRRYRERLTRSLNGSVSAGRRSASGGGVESAATRAIGRLLRHGRFLGRARASVGTASSSARSAGNYDGSAWCTEYSRRPADSRRRRLLRAVVRRVRESRYKFFFFFPSLLARHKLCVTTIAAAPYGGQRSRRYASVGARFRAFCTDFTKNITLWHRLFRPGPKRFYKVQRKQSGNVF